MNCLYLEDKTLKDSLWQMEETSATYLLAKARESVGHELRFSLIGLTSLHVEFGVL